MEEKVKIAEIDIGVEKLVSKTGKVRQEMEALKKANSDLKKETDSLKNATQEQLDQFTRNEVEIKNYRKQISNNEKVLNAYINIQNEDIRTKQQARDANIKLIAIANQLDATQEDQAKLLKKVNAEIDRNTDFIKKNSSEYEKTKINIGNYKEQVKEAINETGLFGGKFNEVTNILTSFSPVFKSLKQDFREGIDLIRNSTKATEGMSASQKALAVVNGITAGSWKILRAAMLGTGIGALVVVLGSLISYLATTQEGVDKVTRVFIPLKTVVQSVFGVMQELGKVMFDAFSNPEKAVKSLWEAIKKNLVNRIEGLGMTFKAIGKIISSGFRDGYGDLAEAVAQTATGVEDIGEKAKSAAQKTGDFFKTAWDQGVQIDQLTKQLRKSEGDYIAEKERLNKVFEEQKQLAEDVTKSTQEREAAANNAIKAQQQIRELTVARLEQEKMLLELKTQQNDTSDEEKKIIKEKAAEIDKAIADEKAKTTELQNKKNSIRKEGANLAIAEQQRIVDAAIQKQKEELDLYIAQQGIKAKSLQEELKIAEDVSKKKLSILEAEYKAGKISKTAYEAEKLNITNEFAKMQADATIANAEKELEAFKASHESKIEANQFLNEQLFNQEQERLNKIAQAERDFQERRLEEGIINQEEYNAAINQVNTDNQAALDELKAQREQAQKDKEALDVANQRAADQENHDYDLQYQLEQYQKGYEQRKAQAKAQGADMIAFERAEAQKRQEIEEAVWNNKMNLASDTFGTLADLLGKESAAGKAAAIAQTTIDTYQAAMAAYKSLSSIPVVGPALGAIAAAAAVKTGLDNVKKITSTKEPQIPRAEKGISMDINGPSHSQGGVKLFDEAGNPIVEAQGGEKMVILKREASRELAVLSALNQKHGGVSLYQGVNYAANGGAIIRNPTAAAGMKPYKFDYDKIGESVGNYVAQNINAVQIAVPVDSVVDVASKAAKVQEGANLN